MTLEKVGFYLQILKVLFYMCVKPGCTPKEEHKLKVLRT